MLNDILRSVRSHYHRMPGWLRIPVGTAYGALPLAVRLGSEFRRFQRLLDQSREWDAELMAAYQLVELRRTIEIAVETIPFYKERFAAAGVSVTDVRSLDDVRRFPFLTKRDVQEHGARMINTRIPTWKRLLTTTGGSTAEPLRFYQVRGLTRSKERAFVLDQWSRFGYRNDSRTVEFRGREVGNPERGVFWEYEPIGTTLVMNSNHMTESNLPAYVEAIVRFKPEFLVGYVSSVSLLARYLLTVRTKTFPELRAVLLASENVYDWQRDQIGKAFGCRVSSHYGHSEMVLLGGECQCSSQLHFYPQYGLLEVIGWDGKPCRRDGEIGELVGTSFHNPVMPFIRYRTGDIGIIGSAECECGLRYPLLRGVQGRLQEFIVTGDGRLVSICVMGAAHLDIAEDVYETQYFQDAPGEVVLRVVPRSSLNEDRIRRIGAMVSEKLGGHCSVRVETVSSIKRTRIGKKMMIEQRLPIHDVSRFADDLPAYRST